LNCVDDCGGGSSWGCTGEPFDLVPPVHEGFDYRAEFFDTLTDERMPGLVLQACNRLGWTDAGCAAGKVAEATTDDAGAATMHIAFAILGVRQQWDGYLTVSRADVVPELRYANVPFASDALLRYTAMTRGELALIEARYGVTDLPGHGLLTVEMFDCDEMPARGVSVEIVPRAPETRRFYSMGQLDLSESATETGKDGFAIFAGVPAGLVTVQATVAASGTRVAEVEVPVQDGVRTVLAIEPRANP
jgi:hypothetical protein